ncbi:MAG: hypothetical protein TRG1_866 [Flavobacteriaceae bacterium FS1-H7996/R]|nr:MAG: hypothetical protein TRG1_866 [Flavobacteriaceae bacterium FS1-H7996/R]
MGGLAAFLKRWIPLAQFGTNTKKRFLITAPESITLKTVALLA